MTTNAATIANRDAEGEKDMPEVMEETGRAVGAEIERFRAHFQATAPQRAREPVWLRRTRSAAFDAFAELGFPSTRQEAWRFTQTTGLAARPFVIPPRVSIGREVWDSISFAGPSATELVFVNGRFAPELSGLGALPAGLDAGSLQVVLGHRSAALEGRLAALAAPGAHPFTALNTASFEDGAVITVSPNTVVEGVVHVAFLADPSNGAAAIHPRVLIQVGSNSQIRIVESYHASADGEYFTNAVTEIDLADGAVVDHYKMQQEAPQAFHMATLHVRCSRSSAFSSHSASLGGAWVRNEVATVLGGEGAHCTLNGVYLGNGRTLMDNRTTIDHARPHCTSHELYKGILAGASRAVFNGTIIVRPDAQKTDAKQTNKALLLSDEALINSKPELEIFANDVRCTHGAAVGQMDRDAVFYLRARGIGLEEARHLLIQAFAGEVLDTFQVDALRERVTTDLLQRLSAVLAEVR
ncbi:MAG: Fe-S cluster assembly protein SufD [Acidobacteriota bacterium]